MDQPHGRTPVSKPFEKIATTGWPTVPVDVFALQLPATSRTRAPTVWLPVARVVPIVNGPVAGERRAAARCRRRGVDPVLAAGDAAGEPGHERIRGAGHGERDRRRQGSG